MIRIDTTYILTRNLSRPIGRMDLPPGVRVAHLHRTTDDGFSGLDAFCATAGFPRNWAATMLGAEGEAFVLFPESSPGAPAVAAGWMTRAPYFVEEIGYTFTPAPEGIYLFGDFVEPAWRGRKLQRWLLHRRLEVAAEARREWVFSLTNKVNAPSLRNQFAEGFEHSATLRSIRLGPLRLERMTATKADVPYGWMFATGRMLPGSIRVRRGRG